MTMPAYGANDMERLPCGCQIGTTTNAAGEGVFLIEPCSLDCVNYRYAVEETKRQGKGVTEIDLR